MPESAGFCPKITKIVNCRILPESKQIHKFPESAIRQIPIESAIREILCVSGRIRHIPAESGNVSHFVYFFGSFRQNQAIFEFAYFPAVFGNQWQFVCPADSGRIRQFVTFFYFPADSGIIVTTMIISVTILFALRHFAPDMGVWHNDGRFAPWTARIWAFRTIHGIFTNGAKRPGANRSGCESAMNGAKRVYRPIKCELRLAKMRPNKMRCSVRTLQCELMNKMLSAKCDR